MTVAVANHLDLRMAHPEEVTHLMANRMTTIPLPPPGTMLGSKPESAVAVEPR